MGLQLSNFQKKHRNQPTQLELLRVIDRRGSSYFKEEKKLYKSLEAGDIGEQKVLHYIQKYGNPNWIILRNVWLNHFGAFECDIILITKYYIYVFEIKNYTGKFTYDNGNCFFENAETKVNPIEQVRGNKVDLQTICSKLYPNIQIKAAVIFAGDDNEVAIHSDLDDIQIVRRTEIKRLIETIAKAEKRHSDCSINPSRILDLLEPYEIQNPFMPSPLTPDEMKQIAGGIYCADCHSFNLQTSKFYVSCNCGLSESREEAIIRTICDYGVLTYSKNMQRQDLFDFFNGQVSLTLFQKTIDEHFNVVNKNRYSYCINQNVPYEKLQPQPLLAREKFFRYTKNREINSP